MSRLWIIDQSLKGIGGHHYDYTLQTAKAAAQRGMEVVSVTNQKFGGCPVLENYCQVIPAFRKTTYCKDSLLNGLRTMCGQQPFSNSCPEELISQFHLSSQNIPHSGSSSSSYVVAFEERTRFGLWKKNISNLLRKNGWLGYRSLWKEHQRRLKSVQMFFESCRNLFQEHPIQPNDHLFFTTINEMELAGLIRYWGETPHTAHPNWHLQFHFDVFHGRPDTHKKQSIYAAPVKELFQEIDRTVPYHQLQFYGTTEAIVNQYQQICCYEVQELIYPISAPESSNLNERSTPSLFDSEKNTQFGSPASIPISSAKLPTTSSNLAPIFHPFSDETNGDAGHSSWKPKTPLKISIAGGVRGEKGQGNLKEMVPELYRRLFNTGMATLSIQRKLAKKWFKKKPFVLPVPEGSKSDSVHYLPHPLSADRYSKFISETEIGLITYDPEAYHSRRAGIFCEYLASGVPVLVPAKCWMADELQKVDNHYRKQVTDNFSVSRSWSHKDLEWSSWNLPSGSGTICFDRKRSPAQACLNLEKTGPDNSLLHLQFHWLWHKQTGYYADLQAIFHDKADNICSTQKATIGNTSDSQPTGVLFQIPPEAVKVFIGFANACGEDTLSIDRLRLDEVSCEAQKVPTSSIGLTFRSETEIPALLEELCRNYRHYRTNAEFYRSYWQNQHDPHQTVQQLLSGGPDTQMAFAS